MWQQSGRGLHIIMLMRSPSCRKQKNKKKTKRPKDATSFRTGTDTDRASCWVKRRCSGGVRCFGPDGTAVGLAPLCSPPSHQMGLPSRDTTVFPPSFSARVPRSWMSSSPFTCHSCLIPAETHVRSPRGHLTSTLSECSKLG